MPSSRNKRKSRPRRIEFVNDEPTPFRTVSFRIKMDVQLFPTKFNQLRPTRKPVGHVGIISQKWQRPNENVYAIISWNFWKLHAWIVRLSPQSRLNGKIIPALNENIWEKAKSAMYCQQKETNADVSIWSSPNPLLFSSIFKVLNKRWIKMISKSTVRRITKIY